jgi:hypothetical protein
VTSRRPMNQTNFICCSAIMLLIYFNILSIHLSCHLIVILQGRWTAKRYKAENVRRFLSSMQSRHYNRIVNYNWITPLAIKSGDQTKNIF